MPEFNAEKAVLDANNFPAFNEVQLLALKDRLYRKNLVVSAPTASGKTLIAEVAIIDCVMNEGKKAIFTCPLRALASEHFNEFKKKYSSMKIRFAVSTGDYDSSSSYLSKYDVIFCTNEKLDSLVRHRADWLYNAGLLVLDEIHEIDSSRGHTLEIVIAKMKTLNSKIRTLALSATIPNSREISKWLDAEHIESNYRPVKLREGVAYGGKISF